MSAYVFDDTPDGSRKCSLCGDYLVRRWPVLEGPIEDQAASRGVVAGVVLRDYMTRLHAQGHKAIPR